MQVRWGPTRRPWVRCRPRPESKSSMTFIKQVPLHTHTYIHYTHAKYIHNIHKSIHFQTYIHTYIHTYTQHIYIHKYIHTFNTYLYILYIHTYIHTYIHAGLLLHPWTFRADSGVLPRFDGDFEKEEMFFYCCLGAYHPRLLHHLNNCFAVVPRCGWIVF